MTTTIPARVLALAKLIDDEPIDWKEREDGSIVIVFCNKGKRTFEPEPVIDPVVIDDNGLPTDKKKKKVKNYDPNLQK